MLDKILKAFAKKRMDVSYSDSDESGLIVWEDPKEIKKVLDELHITNDVDIRIGAGYDGGTIIFPKKK